jgi:hypothetical protein
MDGAARSGGEPAPALESSWSGAIRPLTKYPLGVL